MTFSDLSLLPALQQAVAEEGYTTPTPIQQQAIPEVLAAHDLIGLAQTGTGKTAAFTLPILQRLHEQRPQHPNRGLRCLILTPTRELAIQIGESFANYGRHLKLRHTVIFGGVGQNPQVDALKRHPEILIATPGRLLDLMQQGLLSINTIEIFVLDEADRMLDMGFIHDIRKIIPKLPPVRQTLLFSATMPNEIVALAHSILKNPKQVQVAPPATTAELVEQRVFMVEKDHKRALLKHLLDTRPEIKRVLVFTRTKHGANRVEKDLNQSGIGAAAIHGNKSQSARQKALADFKAGTLRVLVATDIAARGIDIEELSHVINYELPNVPETYVHRIGRTGRAGFSGEAYSFCDLEERDFLLDIQKLIRQEVPVDTDHLFATDNVQVVKLGARPSGLRPPLRSPEHMNRGRGGRDGQRSSQPQPQREGQRAERNPQPNAARDGQRAEQRPSQPAREQQRERPAHVPGQPRQQESRHERGQHQRGSHEARPQREATPPRQPERATPYNKEDGEYVDPLLRADKYRGQNPAYLPREGQQQRRRSNDDRRPGGAGGEGRRDGNRDQRPGGNQRPPASGRPDRGGRGGR